VFLDFVWLIIGLTAFSLIIYFEIVLIKKIIKTIRKALQPKNTITNDDIITIGTQHAKEREKQSKNPKFHRTEREEELSFQFGCNHSDEIQKRTDLFEEYYELACAETDLNKKIELLEKTIFQFEKAKKWFYRTKGGTIYFQDMYEHLHNSRNEDFSYIDQVKEDLEECIEERNYSTKERRNIIV
jgi:hypothetical protein